jgi:hypothetical protein
MTKVFELHLQTFGAEVGWLLFDFLDTLHAI